MERCANQAERAHGADSQNRRQHERRRGRGKVDYRFELLSGPVFGRGQLLDLSRGGLRWSSPHFIPAGTEVWLDILTSKRRIEAAVEVIWSGRLPGSRHYQQGARFRRIRG